MIGDQVHVTKKLPIMYFRNLIKCSVGHVLTHHHSYISVHDILAIILMHVMCSQWTIGPGNMIMSIPSVVPQGTVVTVHMHKIHYSDNHRYRTLQFVPYTVSYIPMMSIIPVIDEQQLKT